jgi:hypothetical protein
MASKTWVLDTETKGTGAEMVPLEKVLERPARRGEPMFVPPKLPQRPAPEPEPRVPRRFRVVDVMTRRMLADGADGRAMLELLRGVRSSVDVEVLVWEPGEDDWRLLTLSEQRAVWDLARRPYAEPTHETADSPA